MLSGIHTLMPSFLLKVHLVSLWKEPAPVTGTKPWTQPPTTLGSRLLVPPQVDAQRKERVSCCESLCSMTDDWTGRVRS